MSSGYVAIPFVVDMNAAHISAPQLDQLLSLVQQTGTGVSNRIVLPYRSAWTSPRDSPRPIRHPRREESRNASVGGGVEVSSIPASIPLHPQGIVFLAAPAATRDNATATDSAHNVAVLGIPQREKRWLGASPGPAHRPRGAGRCPGPRRSTAHVAKYPAFSGWRLGRGGAKVGPPGPGSHGPRGRMQDAAPVVRRSPLRARLGPPTLVVAGSGLWRRRGVRVSLRSPQALHSRLQRPAFRKASGA